MALDSTAWNVLVAYQLDMKWQPKVSYRYAFFEGDDPATPENEAFDGLFTGFYPAVLDGLRRGLPPEAIVSLSTLLTAGTMLVVFLVQLASGVLADQLPGRPGYHPEIAYAAIFTLLAVLLALATWGYARVEHDRVQAQPGVKNLGR